MKRFIIAFVLCLFSLTSFAQLKVSVGNSSLDGFLTNLALDYAAGKINKTNLMDELKFSFGLSSGDFNMLVSNGYNAGDVYLLSMLHKRTGKSIESLIKNRKPGMGWGELAHQLGIHPSELNKMRVAMKKQWKAKKTVEAQKTKAQKDPKEKGQGKSKNKSKGKKEK